MSGPTMVRTKAVVSAWPEIPDALRSLWRACLTEQEDSDVARALVANFIGIAAADEADALREATDRLQEHTPCRAFLLLLDEAATEEHAELAATTRCHGSTRDIVLEEVVLRLPQRAIGQMPGLIRPLLVNDLPNHLYWAAPWPAAETEFDALADLCEHAVVDSRRFGNPARELHVLEQRREQGERISDINWLRLRPWRRALAEAFERFPWQPGTIVKGKIRHGRHATAAAQLLSDWLHERLGAALVIEPDGDADAASPDHVELSMRGIDVAVTRSGPQLVVHVTTDQHCHLPFSLQAPRATAGELLASAIDIG